MPGLGALLVTFTMGTATPQAAAAAVNSETPTELYLRFRTAIQSATTMADVAPFWSSSLTQEFSMMSDADEASTLEMIKRAERGITGLKLIKETFNPAGAVSLFLQAVGPDGRPVVGTVDLVKEQGQWKLVEAEQRKPRGL